MKSFTMWTALDLAINAHQGQTDQTGAPYINHVTVVARGVSLFGEQTIIAALLHDVLEMTGYTAQDLVRAGARKDTLRSVWLLSGHEGQDQRRHLESIAQDHVATWVKISDSAHNSLPERVEAIKDELTRKRVVAKCALEREILWNAAPKSEVRQILRVVNRSLEPLLEDF